jgi:hypothetical protein
MTNVETCRSLFIFHLAQVCKSRLGGMRWWFELRVEKKVEVAEAVDTTICGNKEQKLT